MCGLEWLYAFAVVGVGVGARRRRCWFGCRGVAGRLRWRVLARVRCWGWWFGGYCAWSSLCVCRLLGGRRLLFTGVPILGVLMVGGRW